ncbi:MAG: hypothetical protein ACLQKH_11450 [Steroidobacteraceae bacterium]
MKVFSCKKYISAFGLLLLMGSTALPAAEPIHFTSINIAGATDYFVAGINDRGVVVGSTSADGGNTFVGFVRSPGGQITSPLLDPNDTEPYTIMRAINDEDVVAGFYSSVVPHGFEFAGGAFTSHDFPGAASTALRGINNRGDLSGTYLTSLSADPIGYIQPRTGRAITFKYPEPGSTGIVVGKINDRGDVVGYYTTAAQALAGFVRYANAQFLQISVAGADLTQAYGINDCGIVVGGYVSGGNTHGFFGRPGALQTLDLPGVAATKVLGVNNVGRVVGVYVDAGGVEHGFVTDAVPAASCRSTGE